MALLMIMAGGTGGHIYPALAVAQTLQQQGIEIVWIGTPGGMESRIVPEYGFDLVEVSIRGLRGKGWRRGLSLPAELWRATAQMHRVIRQRQPRALLGMGGFVSGPGGLAARLSAVPLVIHEANAIPGLTNRCLAYIASVILSGFEGVLGQHRQYRFVGNPVRAAFGSIPIPEQRLQRPVAALRVLVTGGSQGAAIFNEVMPQVAVKLGSGGALEIRHQCGRDQRELVEQAYRSWGGSVVVQEFIDDMPAAYAWSDVVISRSGAMTVAELAVAGAAAILCPYPYAVADHQTANARYLLDRKAAVLVPQPQFSVARVARLLLEFTADRSSLVALATAARGSACPQATQQVAAACLEVLHA